MSSSSYCVINSAGPATSTWVVPPVPVTAPPAAHLPPAGPVARTHADQLLYSLCEADQPGRPGPATDKARQLTRIVAYLDVENSARYRPNAGGSGSHIYAHDYCHLAGAYLPRVWWRAPALAQLLTGAPVAAKYGQTVAELNANELYDWLEEFGPTFGWRRTASVTELQASVNNGQVGLIVGQGAAPHQPGHLCAVVPEGLHYPAARAGDTVTIPVQSQAGKRNFRYGGYAWWHCRPIARFGFWLHA